MRRTLTRLLPWLITAGILAYLFARLPMRDVLEAASRAAAWTIPVLAGIVLLVYLADCMAIWKTFGWFVAPMTFRETLTLRGATYLLALVNYALGQGAFVYFLNRTRGVPLVRAAAAVVLIMGINLLLLLLLSTLGLALGAQSLPEVSSLIWIAYVGLGIYVAMLIWRPRWLERRPILDVLLNAGLGGHVRSLLVRLPHVAVLLLLNHVALHAFGVQVPALQTLLCFPVVLLVAVLPISVQGVGPTQGAMIFFFARYAQGDPSMREATVFAASLGTQAIAWCVQVSLGLLCIRSQLVQSLKEGTKEISPAS
jgi:Lysylphosphatidylglycerol synthase TM region